MVGENILFLQMKMIQPRIDDSTQEDRRLYVQECWRCLHDCEACGKCRFLRGRDPDTLFADYIAGKRSYMDITLDIKNNNY